MVGKFVSSCGIWMQNLAAAILVFQVTGSAFAVGVVSFLQFLPPLLLTLWSGSLADRHSRRLLLMAGRAVSGLAVLMLGCTLLITSPPDDTAQTLVYIAVTVMGLGLALSAPSMQAIVPGLVARNELENAVALGAAAPSFARAIGPALAAAIVFAAGPEVTFIVAGVGHLTFVALLATIRAQEVDTKGRQTTPLLGGVRYVVEHRHIGMLILGVAVIAFGSDPVITLTPSLADVLGSGEEAVGILTMMFGVGAIAQVFVLRALRRRLSPAGTGLLGFTFLAGGLGLLAFAPTVLLAGVGFLFCGLGFMVANVAMTTRIHQLVPDLVRGRVLALWSVAFLGARPIVAIVNGWLADRFSLTWAFLVAALAVIAAIPMIAWVFRDH